MVGDRHAHRRRWVAITPDGAESPPAAWPARSAPLRLASGPTGTECASRRPDDSRVAFSEFFIPEPPTSRVPGTKLLSTTSAVRASRRKTSAPAGWRRSRVKPRLPRLVPIYQGLRESSADSGRNRAWSPKPGNSILTTSAPISESMARLGAPARANLHRVRGCRLVVRARFNLLNCESGADAAAR